MRYERPKLKTALFGPTAIEQALLSDLYQHSQGQTRLLGEVFAFKGTMCVNQSQPVLDVYFDGGILPKLVCAYQVKRRDNPTELTEIEDPISFNPASRNTQKHELLRGLLLDRVKGSKWVDVQSHNMESDLESDQYPAIVEVVGYTFRVDSDGVVSQFNWVGRYSDDKPGSTPDCFEPLYLAEYDSYCRLWNYINPQTDEN